MRAFFICLVMLLPGSGLAQTDPGAWLNAYRAEAGRVALTRDARLDAAAGTHAADLAAMGALSHQGRDGSDVMDRVTAQGYRACFVAENIAMGQPDLQATFTAWSNSRGHRRNMRAARARQFGLAETGTIRVLVLAAPC